MTAYSPARRHRALVAGAGGLALVLSGCSDAAPEAADPPATSDPGAEQTAAPTGDPAPPEDGTEPPEDSTDPSASPGEPTTEDGAETTQEPQAQELPRGGTEIFPDFRLFGYSGLPGSPGMGRMGIGDLDERVE